MPDLGLRPHRALPALKTTSPSTSSRISTTTPAEAPAPRATPSAPPLLAQLLEGPHWLEDARFASPDSRRANAAAMQAELSLNLRGIDGERMLARRYEDLRRRW